MWENMFGSFFQALNKQSNHKWVSMGLFHPYKKWSYFSYNWCLLGPHFGTPKRSESFFAPAGGLEGFHADLNETYFVGHCDEEFLGYEDQGVVSIQYFLFSPLLGEDSQFDSYVSVVETTN